MNKWGVQRLFEAIQMVPSTRTTLQVTSAFLGIFREKIRSGPEKSKNVPKRVKIEGYNTRFRTFPGPERRTPWEVIWNESCGLERIDICIYVQFEAILGCMRNQQMGCLEIFRGNANGVKYTRNVTSHVGTPRNVSGENMTRPGKFQKCPKNIQNWRL